MRPATLRETGLNFRIVKRQSWIKACALCQQDEARMQVGLIECVNVDPLRHIAQVTNIARCGIVLDILAWIGAILHIQPVLVLRHIVSTSRQCFHLL